MVGLQGGVFVFEKGSGMVIVKLLKMAAAGSLYRGQLVAFSRTFVRASNRRGYLPAAGVFCSLA
jgi:hypothetical protein